MMMGERLGLRAAAIISCMLATTVASVAEEPVAAKAYVGVSLIDGTGAPLQENMAILVDGDRIVAVQPEAEFRQHQPSGIKIVDASGHYVLPGLIDSHVHMATVPNAAKALQARETWRETCVR